MADDDLIHQQQGRRTQVKTPEPNPSNERINGHKDTAATSPSTPGHLAPFDWDEFETRYEQALAEANNQEKELLEEFDRLVKVRFCRSHSGW
jgi:N-acetyl-anhydromuramyl-L-alanine amidase AmpD